MSLGRDQLRCACSYRPKNEDKYKKPEWLEEHNAGKSYTPSYNIAPSDITPVLVSSRKFKNTAAIALKPMMWGIIPPWHKGDYRSHNLSTNNCRLENIKNSKLYSPILKGGGRCVIVVEGFYEWQTTNKSSKVKQPYYIYAQQEDEVKIDEPDTWNNSFSEDKGWSGIKLLYMAGLYNVWEGDHAVIYSYSVITMDSNTTLSWLHHRMPAMLETEEQIQAWLDIDEVGSDMALAYLKPAKILKWHKVSTAVNNSRNKSTECNKRMIETPTTQKTLTAWFKPTTKRKSDEDNSTSSKRNKL
ncbi:embryonic stem cell-specific 5-hydroxymethylcytosine-binding protein-like isoform X3 [Hyposmocoma kahamanoa]|uniref:embryonic stem cell-specific 5-hydroxymethylcytosine-binding protein-like isoform X3 n=1 Tax=Hyposmocoma kahamanoa TaxID=1477025 RepID=UPI000E6D713A|nr:embryonic stem cell-specific 5-hydroxymethylcytosine-binding protein-like isoform X3 [Hyposmocoma kahamanoa]